VTAATVRTQRMRFIMLLTSFPLQTSKNDYL
jgi:hypothetical protein